MLTTLPAADWSDQEVLSLYRARWHIELLFKRIKQLLSQHRLRAQTEATAKATVYAILVGWMLQQEGAEAFRESLQQMQAVLLEAEQPLEEPEGWQPPPKSRVAGASPQCRAVLPASARWLDSRTAALLPAAAAPASGRTTPQTPPPRASGYTMASVIWGRREFKTSVSADAACARPTALA